jgi:hypothetical protein
VGCDLEWLRILVPPVKQENTCHVRNSGLDVYLKEQQASVQSDMITVEEAGHDAHPSQSSQMQSLARRAPVYGADIPADMIMHIDANVKDAI